MSTVEHFRLVRKARTRFDPGPHGGATAVSDNVEHFERIGIIHEKTVAEQIYDDARYERIALEDEGPTSAKRNWLQHNRTLRDERARSNRSDLEALVPADAVRVLVVGDIAVELAGHSVTRVSEPYVYANGSGSGNGKRFDAAVVALAGVDAPATLREIAGLVRSGGAIVGTAPAARNRRRMEEFISAALADDARQAAPPAADGTTRR